MEVKIGEIWKAKHTHEPKIRHPFVIINISRKYLWTVQCSSIKSDNHSKFSRENRNYYRIMLTGMEVPTDVLLDTFCPILRNNMMRKYALMHEIEFQTVCSFLLRMKWNMNHNQYFQMINEGLKNYGKKYEIG